ncbi:MAG: hypothetical protein ABEJ68_10745 [Halobacteriaceae archaeon]
MAYLSSIVASRFEHPILASLIGFSIALALLGLFMSEAWRLLVSPVPKALIDLWRPVVEPLAVRHPHPQNPDATVGTLHPVVSAFMGVFSILWGALALFGYGIFGTAKLLSIIRDQMAPTSA